MADDERRYGDDFNVEWGHVDVARNVGRRTCHDFLGEPKG